MDGVYANLNTHTCDSCNTSCANCNGPNDFNCLTCPKETFLYNNRCYDKCPTNTYPNNDNNTCSTECPANTYPNKDV